MRVGGFAVRAPVAWRIRVVGVAALTICVLLLLRGFYRRELYHFAGGAQWMWVGDDVRERRPVAGLFCRRLWLGDRPARALAKVCVDQQYVLWVNGQPAAAGRNRPGFQLDVVPITDLLIPGDNLIVIEARSPTSVGAVLFSLDLYPTAEGRRAGDRSGRNVVVSDGRWAVLDSWQDATADIDLRHARRPWIWGRPPNHPWSYPGPEVWDRPLVQSIVSEPLPVAPEQFRRAGENLWACDLGRRVTGYLWLEDDGSSVTGVDLRPSGAREGRPVTVVRIAGQRRWLFPGRVDGQELIVSSVLPPAGLSIVEAYGHGHH